MEPLKEERYKKIRILIVFLLMNLCFYGIFSVEHFAADTYVSENVGWADTAALYFSNGRWLMTLICLFSGFFSYQFCGGEDPFLGYGHYFSVSGRACNIWIAEKKDQD